MMDSGKITGLLGIKPESDPNPLTDPKDSFNMRDPEFLSLKRENYKTLDRGKNHELIPTKLTCNRSHE